MWNNLANKKIGEITNQFEESPEAWRGPLRNIQARIKCEYALIVTKPKSVFKATATH